MIWDRLAALVVLVATGCAAVPEGPGSVVSLPHSMAPAHGVDLFYMAPGFQPRVYDRLIIEEPKLAVQIRDRELTYTPWAQDLHAALVQALSASGVFAEVSRGGPSVVAGGKGLILESAIVEFDPGNQMQRWLFGEYGAGNTFIQIDGRILDAQTQEVLVQFSDRRRGAAVFHLTGGDSVALLQEDLRGIAKDVSKALAEAMAGSTHGRL